MYDCTGKTGPIVVEERKLVAEKQGALERAGDVGTRS